MTPALQRTLWIMGLVLLLGLGVWLFYNFVALPTVRLKTPQNVTLTLTNQNGQATGHEERVNTADFRVAPGTYIAKAEGPSGQALAFVEVGFFETKQLEFSFATPLNLEPLAEAPAYAATMQSDGLYYFNPTASHVFHTDAQGISTDVSDDGHAHDDGLTGLEAGGTYKVQPIAGGRQIVSSFDRLFLLENGSLLPLNTEGISEVITPLSVVLGGNSLQESFVVAVGKSLYFYASADARPEKIADLGKSISFLAFGGTRVIAFSTELAYSREDVTSAYSSFAVQPIVIDVQSKDRFELDGPLVDATISPDGRLATLQRRQTNYTTLYNLAERKTLYDIEKPSLASPLWVSNDELVYERDKTLWRFNTTARTGAGIGVLLRNATSITTVDGQSFLITSFSQETSTPKGIVYRLSTKPVNPALIAASEQTPISGENYQIKFVNIDTPRLFIETVASVNNPADEAAYLAKLTKLRQDALADLNGKGIDTSAFTVTFSP